MATEAYELDACLPSYTGGPPPQGAGKAWAASHPSTSRGDKDLGPLSPALSVSDSHCQPPYTPCPQQAYQDQKALIPPPPPTLQEEESYKLPS